MGNIFMDDDTLEILMTKYPFLAETGNYLRDKSLTLEELNNPDWKPAIEKAHQRIMVATSGKIYTSNLEQPAIEILSFIIAIILLKKASVPTFNRRFSLAEARRAENFLKKDLVWKKEGSIIEHVKRRKKSQQFALEILKNEFKMAVVMEEDSFKVKVADYLKRAAHFHEREWKLVNRRVEQGFVYLSSDETVRLIRKELDELIGSKIRSVDVEFIPETFQNYVLEIQSLAKKILESVTFSGEYPPCVKHGIEVLERGENLPHSGRFLLATYLLARGQTIDQIVPLFKNAPDYNERITRYQLEHISGASGKGTKYQCPSCDKLRSENLCFAIPECDGIINPVQFGRGRKKP
jgi:DNA primase large subunit